MDKAKTKTIVVGYRDFEKIAYRKVYQFVLHGKRLARRVLPETGQEIGENRVIFTGEPKELTFRRRFTAKRCTRSLRYIIADNSDRYDLKMELYFKK